MKEEFSLSEKRKKMREDIDYLFSKINWGSSFLDARAIKIMNEFWKDIIEADEEFIRLLKENLCNFNKTDLDINLKIIDKFVGDKLNGNL